MPLPTLTPDSQLLFAVKLDAIRGLYFNSRLTAAVAAVPLKTIDAELHATVSAASLSALAKHGLRGETCYPVPSLLEAEPYLLGYYRLIYGISQKQFYQASAFSSFKGMELRGALNATAKSRLPDLCAALAGTADVLVASLPTISKDLVHELQVMTLGVAFDGGKRNLIGQGGVAEVLNLVNSIVPQASVISASPTVVVFTNASGRKVTVAMSPDPDVSVVEEVGNALQPVLAIEVKAGTDASNRLNRLGEAEKSHLKARADGHTQFWTIVRVNYTQAEVRANSPTTQQFWHLDQIKDPNHAEHVRFVGMFKRALGIP